MKHLFGNRAFVLLMVSDFMQNIGIKTIISGSDAFKLYDTYGFPFDLTEDYASEHGLTVDREGFDAAMKEQRDRARAARHETESMKVQGGVCRGKRLGLYIGISGNLPCSPGHETF